MKLSELSLIPKQNPTEWFCFGEEKEAGAVLDSRRSLMTETELSGLSFDDDAPLAQLVEQLTLNQWVPGSNP